MIRTPPHKQTDSAKTAGQILTLGDYIKQKTDNDPKKLSFKEWALKTYPNGLGVTNRTQTWDMMQAAWNASRDNM